MTYPYLHQNVSDASFANVLLYVNNITDGFLGFGILIAVFFIMFIAQKQYTTERALTGSLFSIAILTPFLRILGLLSTTMFWLIIVTAGLAIIYLVWEQSHEN